MGFSAGHLPWVSFLPPRFLCGHVVYSITNVQVPQPVAPAYRAALAIQFGIIDRFKLSRTPAASLKGLIEALSCTGKDGLKRRESFLKSCTFRVLPAGFQLLLAQCLSVVRPMVCDSVLLGGAIEKVQIRHNRPVDLRRSSSSPSAIHPCPGS